MKLAVCVPTYKRPAGLTRLLEGLQAQTFADAPPDLRVVVVDNDPQGSARSTCDAVAGAIRFPLDYVIETQRGIAHARNALLDHVGDAEWLAFIDDDEVPAVNWLDELLRVQRDHEADVVAGPAVPLLPDAAPDWVRQGRFLEYPRYQTGSVLDHAYTHNVLFRARILAETGLRFDPRWALMGCEDLHFFRSVGLAGYKIVWADEAVVSEWIPANRVTAGWILRRAFRFGNSDSWVERELYPKDNPRGHLLIRAVKRLLVGLALTPIGWLRGRRWFVHYLRHVCYGAGMVAGWFRFRYEPYRITDGG